MRPGDIDRVMLMMVALMAEVSVLRDRLDTHEALADARVAPSTAAVEGYELTASRQAAREANRQALLKRVFRVISHEREAAADNSKSGGHGDETD